MAINATTGLLGQQAKVLGTTQQAAGTQTVTTTSSAQAQLAELAQLLQSLQTAMQQQSTTPGTLGPNNLFTGTTSSPGTGNLLGTGKGLGTTTGFGTTATNVFGTIPHTSINTGLSSNTSIPDLANFNTAVGSISGILGTMFSNLGETGNQGLLGGTLQSVLTPYTPITAGTMTSPSLVGSSTGMGLTGIGMTSALGANALPSMGLGAGALTSQDQVFSSPWGTSSSAAYSPLTSSFLSASQNMTNLLSTGINTSGSVTGTMNPF